METRQPELLGPGAEKMPAQSDRLEGILARCLRAGTVGGCIGLLVIFALCLYVFSVVFFA